MKLIDKIQSKDFSPVEPVFKEIPSHMQEVYIKEGVRSWAFMAINAIAERVAMLDFETYKINRDGSEDPVDHPINKILRRPNPLQTKAQFIWQMMVYYLASGECPIILDRPTNPTELIILNPQKIEPVFDKDKGICEYIYSKTDGTRMHIKSDLIIFLNRPSLITPFRGEGIMKYIASTLDIDYYYEEYLKKFFWNDATPGFMLTTDQQMSKEWVDRLMAQLQTKHRSWKKAFKAMVLTGGLKPQKVGTNLSELQIKEITEYTRDKTLAGFKVPKSVLGITDDVRSNADVGDRTFSRYAVEPNVNMIEEEFNEFLIPKYGRSENIVIRFENPVKEDLKLNAEIHKMYVDSGVLTVNEIRQELGYEPLEEEEQEETQEEPMIEEEDPKELMGEEKEKDKSYNKIFEDIVKGNKPMRTRWKIEEIEKFHQKKLGATDKAEYVLKEKLNKYFDQMINSVIRNTSKKSIIESGEASINYNDDIEEKKIVSLLIPMYEDIFEKQTALTFALLGLNNIIPTTSIIFKDFVKNNAFKWATSVSETNKKRITKIMIDWAEKEQSIADLKLKLKSILSDQANHRIENIVRTEVQRVAGYSSMEVYKQTGAVGYEWFTAEDERVCPLCRPMNGKKVYINQTFFPKNSVFVGDDTKTKIKFTNESIKHPPLHGNCRCSLLGVYNESEMPNNPLKFREESERRLQILNEREEEKQKAIELVEKLTQAQEKIKERNKKLDERENKIKEIEKML